MQDRFEKEVQRKMEELRLTPSAPVWEKIEMEITVEKKRRRVFFWLFFAGLLLAGGTWWLSNSFNENDKQLHSQNTENQTTNKPKIETENTTVDSKDNISSKELTKTSDDIVPKQNEKTNEEGTTTTVNSIPGSTQKLTSAKKLIAETHLPLVNNKKDSAENNKIVNTPVITTNESSTKSKEDVYIIPKPADTKANSTITETNNPVLPSSQSSVSDSLAKESLKKELTADSSSKKKVASNKKWNKQVNVMVGSSNLTSGLSLKSGGMQDANFAAIGSGTSGVVTNNNQASEVSAGFAFSLGFCLAKKLNEHWEISLGLHYTHLSTNMKVGDKKHVDTGTSFAADGSKVNEFFTNTSSSNYTNRFHILELPVNISYKPSVKLPLYISAGLSYGRLISTNALTFNSTSNVYYKNNDSYARNLLPAQLAVQYRFEIKNKLSLQAGPFIQYNLLKFQNEPANGKSHIAFAGLKTIVNF